MARIFFLLLLRPGNLLLPSEPCYSFLQIKKQLYVGNANMHMALNNILLCPITSMNINKMCYFMRNCMKGLFVFLVGVG